MSNYSDLMKTEPLDNTVELFQLKKRNDDNWGTPVSFIIINSMLISACEYIERLESELEEANAKNQELSAKLKELQG